MGKGEIYLYIYIYMYLSKGGGGGGGVGGDLTKKLGCVIIMFGLVWLFKENLKDNLIH